MADSMTLADHISHLSPLLLLITLAASGAQRRGGWLPGELESQGG
jgi:hypothetical protein